MRARTIVAGLAAFALVACDYYYGGPDGTSGRPPTNDSTEALIQMVGNAFLPDTDTVFVGAVVTWRNRDSTFHTVTTVLGAPEFFDSGDIPRDSAFVRQMNFAGIYPYLSRHDTTAGGGGMRGVLLVR